MIDYDWQRLQGLGFDLDFIENTANMAEPGDDPFQSTKPNGGMVSTQLKIALEKIQILLSMVEPEDNFEPWVATKVNNAAVNLASVADYLRFGGET